MGMRVEFSLTPISDADGIAESQSPVGAGDLTIDGTLAVDGAVELSSAHIVTITSDGNDVGNTFTVTGTDSRDVSISEAVTGPNVATVVTTKYFKTIESVAISGAAVGNITVGVNGETVSPWALFNHGKITNVGFGVTLGSGASLIYSIEHTFGNIHENSDIDVDIFEHADTRDKTANDDGNYAFAAVATRLTIKSFTSGTATVVYVLSF